MLASSVKPETKKWFKSIDHLDDYGFQIRPYMHWLPESIEQQKKRVEMNQLIYRQYMKNGSKFPREIHKARQEEYLFLQSLKGALIA